MKNKITLLNIISSIILQLITIISQFILPKIILIYFGSNINGLISSLNQFLNFITLIEGGITGVILANLYLPLEKKEMNKVNSILATASKFYKKIGLIYIIYTLILGIVYPILSNTEYSVIYIFTLTLILSLNLFVQYMFSITNKTLLNADKKIYIINFTQSVILALNIILSYISVKIYPSIHLLKFISGILYFIQPIIFNYYIRKNYDINYNTKIDNKLINQRWNGFAINIAAFIHQGTDIAILTIFSNLETISTYSVYTLVTNGLRQIINAISSAIVPTIGRTYATKDNKDINNKLDLYEYINNILVFFLFSIASLLISPFVVLYTKGINDTNYYQPIFGYLILISEALYLIKNPHLNLAYSANKFKEITKIAYIEAIMNIIISIILVNKLGLVGVAFGTLIAMLYRTIKQVSFTTKIIENRKQIIFYKKIIILLIISIIGLFICNTIYPLNTICIINWVTAGIIYSITYIIIYTVTSLIFFKKEIKYIINYIKK